VVRRGLTREQVLAAAVRVVDEEGLDALSMRRLGQALGVEAMSLYNHVAGKDDLLDGVHGAILAGVPRPARRGAWVARARALARSVREVLRAHPRALVLFATRPAVVPASLALFEEALAIVDDAGLDPDEGVRVVHGLLAYVVGSALWHFGEGGADGRLGPAALEPFPRAREAALRLLRSGWDTQAEFELGLDAFLTGVEARRRRS
jgi:TetR/AcrR family transcriptional regulator, tetracycline repressor protein